MSKYGDQMIVELEKLTKTAASIYDRGNDDPAEKYKKEELVESYGDESDERQYKNLLKFVVGKDPKNLDELERKSYEHAMERIHQLENILDETTVAIIREEVYSETFKESSPERQEKYFEHREKEEKELPFEDETFASILTNLSKLASKLDSEGNIKAANEVDKAIRSIAGDPKNMGLEQDPEYDEDKSKHFAYDVEADGEGKHGEAQSSEKCLEEIFNFLKQNKNAKDWAYLLWNNKTGLLVQKDSKDKYDLRHTDDKMHSIYKGKMSLIDIKRMAKKYGGIYEKWHKGYIVFRFGRDEKISKDFSEEVNLFFEAKNEFPNIFSKLGSDAFMRVYIEDIWGIE